MTKWGENDLQMKLSIDKMGGNSLQSTIVN